MRKEKLKNPRSATEKLKKNGGCIAEGELGVRPPFLYEERWR
jgi:hypothetical protein